MNTGGPASKTGRDADNSDDEGSVETGMAAGDDWRFFNADDDGPSGSAGGGGSDDEDGARTYEELLFEGLEMMSQKRATTREQGLKDALTAMMRSMCRCEEGEDRMGGGGVTLPAVCAVACVAVVVVVVVRMMLL